MYPFRQLHTGSLVIGQRNIKNLILLRVTDLGFWQQDADSQCRLSSPPPVSSLSAFIWLSNTAYRSFPWKFLGRGYIYGEP